MHKDPMNLTNLRANLYNVIDEIIRTGKPVEILRNGHKIKLELATQHKKNFFDKLKAHPHYLSPNVTDEDLINTPSEWNYDFS